MPVSPPRRFSDRGMSEIVAKGDDVLGDILCDVGDRVDVGNDFSQGLVCLYGTVVSHW